jgi:hypothetical protein
VRPLLPSSFLGFSSQWSHDDPRAADSRDGLLYYKTQVPPEDILHTPQKSLTDHAGLVTRECLESSRPPLH